MSVGQRLRLRPRGLSNSLWNEDLATVQSEERTWGVFDCISLWTAVSICIPAYMLASGLIAAGMNWVEALGTILLGNVIALGPMLLNAHAGTKYGIAFPVYARASFGVLGVRVPAILRSLVTSGWFGIQCWIGGEALFTGIRIFLPRMGESAVWWCFASFWLVNMGLIWRGWKTIRSLQILSSSLTLLVGAALMFWMVGRAGGIATVLANLQPYRPLDGPTAARPAFWRLFPPALTAIMGFWATMALNVSGFARYARSKRAQIIGQAAGVPVAMTLYCLIAIAVTAATIIVTPDHRPTWNPIPLIASAHQPVAAVIGLAVVLLATLNTNLAVNVAGPSNDFSNLRPNLISFRMGALITGLLGIACMPWYLLSDPGTYLNGWLVGCSGLLGPVAGIMIADYFVIRRRSLDVNDLYMRDGVYEYYGGVNRRALLALASGVVAALIGLFVPQLHWLYDFAWFVGSAVAAMVYLALLSGPDVRAMIPPTPLLIPGDGFEAEAPLA